MFIPSLLFCWILVSLWISAHSLPKTFEVIPTATSPIQDALNLCKVELDNTSLVDSCVIVLPARPSPYNEPVSVGIKSTHLSEIRPKGTDTVTWVAASDDSPVISLTGDAANWHIHGGAGRLLLRAHVDVVNLVEISPSEGDSIAIGPGVELQAHVPGVAAAILLAPGAGWTDCEFRGLTFTGPFDSSIQVKRTGSVTIRDSFFRHTRSEEVISVEDSDRVVLLNNIVEIGPNIQQPKPYIRLSDGSSHIVIAQNTFVCGSMPTKAPIYLLRDVEDVTVVNNLFAGECGDNSSLHDIVREQHCEDTKCLRGVGSMRCNRADATVRWMHPDSTWTVENCSSGGVGLPIPFVLAEPSPVPYYELTKRLTGVNASAFGELDMLGHSRNATPTLGALEFYPTCDGLKSYEWDVCHRRGKCNETNQCECEAFYAPPNCLNYYCHDGLPSKQSCHEHGDCDEPGGDCKCEDFYTNTSGCRLFTCEDGFEVGSNESCWGHGSCSQPNGACVCDDFWSSDKCSVFECEDGILHNSKTSCSGHGHCTDAGGKCLCDAHWDGGTFCLDYTCADGSVHDLPNTCSGHGNCSGPGADCVCYDPTSWGDPSCGTPFCEDGKLWSDPSVCSGHGNCTTPGGECVCFDPSKYGGTHCDTRKCIDGKLLPDACSKKGTCSTAGGECVCDAFWGGSPEGSDCNIYKCKNGFLWTDPKSCSGHGKCNGPGEDCNCTGRYGGPPLPSIRNCSFFFCEDDLLHQWGACGGHGGCEEDNPTCKCHPHYGSAEKPCDTFKCRDGKLHTAKDSCSAHGHCETPNEVCKCVEGWTGAHCSEEDKGVSPGVVGGVVGGLLGGIVLILIIVFVVVLVVILRRKGGKEKDPSFFKLDDDSLDELDPMDELEDLDMDTIAVEG